MKRKILGFLLMSVAFISAFTSCIKETDDLGDIGKPFVKFLESPESKMFFSPFTDKKKIDLFSLRRDVNSNSELNKAVTIKLLASPAMIAAFNDDNNDSFEALPENAYTITNPAFQKTTDGYNVSFADGDFAKELSIELDGSKWIDLSKKYAFAFVVENAPGLTKTSDKDSIIVFLSIKNKYDGSYEVAGSLTDAAVPTISGAYPHAAELHTTGPNSVAMFEPTIYGDYYHLITSAGATSVYGAFCPVFTMDDAGKVISVVNKYGQPASNGRSAVLDPTGVNKFTINADGSKTLEVSYKMLQPGTTVRTTFTEKWTYKKPR